MLCMVFFSFALSVCVRNRFNASYSFKKTSLFNKHNSLSVGESLSLFSARLKQSFKLIVRQHSIVSVWRIIRRDFVVSSANLAI